MGTFLDERSYHLFGTAQAAHLYQTLTVDEWIEVGEMRYIRTTLSCEYCYYSLKIA